MEPREREEDFGIDGDERYEGDSLNSEEDNAARDSRTAGFAKGLPKKRKLADNYSDDEGTDESEEDADRVATGTTTRVETDTVSITTSPEQHVPNKQKLEIRGAPPKHKSKPGIIYISRIPPYLKPQALRHMISIHGPVTNLFLTPEPPSSYHQRVHTHHGNKKRQFIDGWVEFKHKRHAKACVDALNGRTTAEGLGVGAIGGRKGGKGRWYRDDVWSVKYLRGFLWDDLMQSARTEEREREEKVRLGIIREKKAREAFLAGVEGAKIEETRRKKRRRKEEEGEAIGPLLEGRGRLEEDGKEMFMGQYEAVKAKSKPTTQQERVHRILDKIF